MDCQTALEYLDCVRPDSDDLDLPVMTDARAHLDLCDACQETFAKNQSFDRAVTDVALDVDVPVSLRSSLPDSRRRTMRAAALVACALMLGVTAWLWQSRPEQFTEKQLLERLPINLSATVEFDAGFQMTLPIAWSGDRRLRVSQEFRGIDLDEDSGHDAAVGIFDYSPSRNAPVKGILAAIPARRVLPLPNAGRFAEADSRYIQKDGRRLVAAIWQEDDTVYICMVLGSAADLEQIQRNLSTSAA